MELHMDLLHYTEYPKFIQAPYSCIFDFGFPNYYYKESHSKNILYYNSV